MTTEAVAEERTSDNLVVVNSEPVGPGLPLSMLRGRSRNRTPRRPLSPGLSATIWFMLASASLALWVLVYAIVLSPLQEARGQRELFATFREQLALATAPLGGSIEPGSPVAVLQIPRLNLRDAIVVEGTAARDLQAGPGHRRDTALPGQAGVSVIFGRAVTFGAPFARIPSLQAGDTISVTTAQGQFTYVVSRVRRIGDPGPTPVASGGSRLTLVTIEGSGWQSGWAPSRTVYVDALLRGAAQPAPPGRPAGLPMAETAMQADPGVLATLVLWLAGLLITSVVWVWAKARWGRWQAWVLGLPIVLALVWGATGSALQLLPNLL